MVVFLATAFTVAAMIPSDEPCCDEFKPLEVEKTKITGPAVVVIGNQAAWQLDITVTNNLEQDVVGKEVVDEVEDDPVFYYTTVTTTIERDVSQEPSQTMGVSTITDVVVKDTIPKEFQLIEYTPSHGYVSIESGEDGATLLTWNVGNLEPMAQATLELSVQTANGGISKPGNYLINSGASATGFQYSTQEILTDGPTNSMFVTVTDGEPNEPPVADAGITQMAFVGNPVYLDGSGSFDPDGTVVKYTWYLGEECIGNSRSIMSYLPVGVHTVTLHVEDNRRATDTDEVTVIIYEEDAQVEGGIMIGIVRDATTRRGFDPYIQVSNENFAISTWTDMGGNYKIIGIPAGHYEVFCMSEGYRDFHGQVDILENEEVEYDIDMIRT